jgi:UDP-glucose 4-epimerase
MGSGMRVLVTGGAGFIGSHLVDALLDAGHEVRVFDDHSTGSAFNLIQAHLRGVRTHRGSVAYASEVGDAFDKFAPEVVYHLAAQIDVRASVDDPGRDARINVRGTVNVLEAARWSGTRRFVLASSAAVYGHRNEPVDLTTPYMPISPYGASKAAAEAYALTYGRMATLAGATATDPARAIADGLKTTTVILSNVYGPRQRADFGAVNLFARRALSGEPVTLYGDGRNVRDYVEVKDAVRMLMWAGGCQVSARTHRMIPERVLCGTGVGTTDADLWKLVCRVVGDVTGRAIDAEEMAGFAPTRPADIRSMVFDFPEGFAGRTPLDVGVRMLVEELCKEGLGQ